MKIFDEIMDIFIEVDLYKNSEKGKKDKEKLDQFIFLYGKHIEEKILKQ